MKLAIMQPYLFPYLGYFQLVAMVDKFVFYDDVNFIKGGWINRNRILINGEARYLTVPLSEASQFKKINQIFIHQDDAWQKRLLDSVRCAYSKAPHFNTVKNLVAEVFCSGESRIAPLATRSIVLVSDYLGLDTRFVDSSSIYRNAHLSSADRVIDICLRESARQYYNLPGGRGLYDKSAFERHGMELHFIEPSREEYRQGMAGFCPGLSVIDALMFNDRDTVRNMLAPKAKPVPGYLHSKADKPPTHGDRL